VFFAGLLTSAMTGGAQAQSDAPMSARLSAEKIGDVETGSYDAGDNVAFSLDPYGDKYLLRFAGSPESFVLYGDRVALGGRVLKYDTGVTALRISVWGGMTLYTEQAPGGLPATRIGDSIPQPRPTVSNAAFNAALNDETAHMSYVQQLRLRFSAELKTGSDEVRGLAFDTLTSAQTGIERVVGNPAAHQAFSGRIDAVKIMEGDRPGISLSGKTLLVHFAPSQGQAGRDSSRAVAQELGKLLAISEPG
jgi:Domain of unknown function (DUF4908)